MAVPPAPDVEPVSGEHADEQHGSHDRSSTSPGFRLVLAVVLVLVLVGSLVSTGLLLASRTSAASGGLPGRVGALLSGENAVAAERMGTELVCPVKGPTVEVEDVAPEDRPLTAADFDVDARVEDPAVCPAGHFSTAQAQTAPKPNRVTLTFDRQTCEDCALFHACPALAGTGTF